MKNKLMLSFVAFVLAFALPVGSAFAASSPNADSPNVNSPNVNSPNVNSPNVNSPNVNSPNVDSPNVDSPNVDSPNVDSPNVDSPIVGSPANTETNVIANTISGSRESAAPASAVDGGTLLSPHSGAVNLATVFVATVGLFAAAGVAAWGIRKRLLD